MKALPEKLAEQYADDKSKAYYIGENGEKKWYITPRGQYSKEDFLAGYQAAKDETNLPTSAKWISVKERLPEDGQDVLVCVNGQVLISYVHGMKGFSSKWGLAENGETIWPTHWMPLPEAPKGEG